MSHKQLSAQEVTDLIWVCRRLAASLQGGKEIMPAVDALSAQAPPGPGRLLRAMRESFVAGNSLGRGLIPLGYPGFMWGMILAGEVSSIIPEALTRLADRLEAEQAAPEPHNRRLYTYSLAFGRLGLLLKTGVPVLQALEVSADSVPDEDVRGGFLAVRQAVREGAMMSNTFASVTDDLPPTVIEIIADAEGAGRLDDALSIIGDYLLDEAGKKQTRRGRKEASNA